MRRLVLDQGLMGVGRAAAHCSWLGALNVPDVRFLAHCPTGAQLSADGWEATKERAGNLWSGANDLAKSGWEGAKETAGAVSNTAGAVWGGVKQGASEAWSGAKGAAQSGWDWLKKKVGGMADDLVVFALALGALLDEPDARTLAAARPQLVGKALHDADPEIAAIGGLSLALLVRREAVSDGARALLGQGASPSVGQP